MLECAKQKQFHTHRKSNNKKKKQTIIYQVLCSFLFEIKNETKWNHQTARAREAKQRKKNREQGMHALTFTWAFSLRERVCVCVCVQLSPDRRKKNRTAKKKIQNKVTHTWKMNASTARLSWTIYTTCEYKYAENWLLYILNRTSYPIRLCGVMWCDVMVSDVILLVPLLLFGPVVSPHVYCSVCFCCFLWRPLKKIQPSLI